VRRVNTSYCDVFTSLVPIMPELTQSVGITASVRQVPVGFIVKPITKQAYELTRAQGFYQSNPGAAIAIEQVTLNPPTENSKAIRLGSFILIRGVIEDELELAIAGEKSAKDALDDALKQGNELLRQFERANK
jgi:ABC-type glycerol-3-phosphate transport system substrate-binding protein